MAGYQIHSLFGIIICSLLIYVNHMFDILELSNTDIIILVPVIFLYSILADIDIASSKVRQLMTTIGLAFLLVSVFADIKWLAISITLVLFIFQFVQHRTFIHTITAAIVFSAPLIFFNYVIALFAFIAYLSHLLIDQELKFI